MKKLNYLLLPLIGLLCLAHSTSIVAANGLPIAPFEAHYQVLGAGLPIGESVMTLTDTGNGHYQMSSNIRPIGFAALLISDQINEHASGIVQDGAIRPLHYEQQRSGGKESHTTRITFDWQNGTLQAQHDTEKATLPLSPRLVDPLSLHLLVMSDLQQGHPSDEYTFVDETEFKTYQVKRHGEETLKTPLGALDTLRVTQSNPGSNRITTLWFAPSLGYLPVQIAQERKGMETLRLVIQEVKGISLK